VVGRLTKAVKHIKETYQHHRSDVNEKTPAAHRERPGRDVPPPCYDIRRNGQYERHRAENNEGAHQVLECCFTSQRDGTKSSTKESTEQSCRNGTAELLIYKGEETCEGRCVVTSQCPPDTRNGQDGADGADHQGGEDNKEETECGAVVVGGLRIYFSKGERTIAIKNSVKI
jgi:hypothetical protein